MPLADKLRIYGQPWPMKVGGRVVCWLVPDDAAAERADVDGVVYTAAEVEHLASLPAEDVQNLHGLKARFGGTVYPSRDE